MSWNGCGYLGEQLGSNMNESNADREFKAESQSPKAIVSGTLASASRRRLIRAGTTAVPVIATLASRPVLGATCNSTSAWGSGAGVMQASVTARMQDKAKTVYPWTVENWNSNTSSTSTLPWGALFIALAPGTGNANSLRSNYTVAELFSDVGTPMGFTGTQKVSTLLSASDTFKKQIAVAKLNLKIPNTNLTACGVTGSMIKDMADGTFTPPIGGGDAWNPTDIGIYLANNGIAPLA
jgi:hypothetical protein